MAAPPKPLRAEYAKSNRSTCKSCQSIITKDSFRIAKVVPATQFDGYMPVWHHASCMFKMRGKINSLDDVEGLDNLRWEDQKKLRAYIEGTTPVTDSKGTEEATGGGGGGDGEYAIENAKSSRSACKSCNEKIEKGQVRISTMVSSESSKFRGKAPAWRHAKCFFDLGWWEQPIIEMPGWEDLSNEDQATVKKLVKTGSSKGKSTVNSEEDPKQKGTKRKGKGEDEPTAKNVANGQNKRARKGEVQLPSKKGQGAVGNDQNTEYEKQLEKQSKALWNIKDNLKKNVDTSEMRMMLEENRQDPSGSEYDLRERCADGMLFGALGKCPTCQGPLECHGGQYRCRGNLSEWTKCTYTTISPERLEGKWKVPEDLDNDYLNKWFKSQKAKREKRLLLAKHSSGNASAEKQAESSGKKNVKDNLKGCVLEGLKVAIVGKKIQAKWKQLIHALGGQVLKEMTSETDFVVTTDAELELEENRTKLQNALDLRIPVVKEDFLTDCLDKGALVPVNQYLLETAGKFASIVKVKVKGRSAVHEESGLQDVGHILEDGKTIFNTTLNLSDLSTGINSYYILQIIEHDSQNVHHLFRRWGRVGNSKIGSSKLEKLSKSEAIHKFGSLFREKTGNDWEAWENKVDFQKQPNKFYPLEIDYGVDNSSQDVVPLGTRSKLDPRVISLMRMLFDIETYKAAMMEFEINMSEMPLGKLSRRNIDQAFQVLTEIQNIFGSNNSEKRNSLLMDASNRFFTLVPHVHPRIISDEEALKSKIDMLEALRDIELASKLIGSTGGGTDEDPLDINYKKLCCNIVPVPHDSDDFELVKRYLERTHAPTHTEWNLELEDVYTVAREGEEDAFLSQKEKHGNCMLLWHGSRTTNYVGILSQGLRIAPPEAPVTGYMFGKGVYFADLVSKSAQYCFTTKKSPIGLMLLSEVALGQVHELKAAQYMEKPPRGKQSTKGLGKNKPLETEFQTWGDQVMVPCGRPVASGISNTTLLYNEYIVYDTTQINLRFLLKVRFKHKSYY